MTPAEAVEHFELLLAGEKATNHFGEALAANVAKRHIKNMYGSHELEDLAPSTQAERIRLGFTANDPLLRDGSLLRDSIKVVFNEFGFRVGSEEPVAEYQEFGMARPGGYLPARPAIAMGGVHSLKEIEGVMAATAQAVFGNRRKLESLGFAEVAVDEVA